MELKTPFKLSMDEYKFLTNPEQLTYSHFLYMTVLTSLHTDYLILTHFMSG